MPKKVPTCKRCGKQIRWEQNSGGKWVPYNYKGTKIHWETCSGEPEKDTPLALKARIKDLESAYRDIQYKLYLANNEVVRVKETHQASEEYMTYLHPNVTQVLQTARTWGRAQIKQTGREEFHRGRLKVEVLKLLDCEEQVKQRKQLEALEARKAKRAGVPNDQTNSTKEV